MRPGCPHVARIVLLVLVLSGCAQPPPSADSSPKRPAAATGPKRYDADNLPPVAEPLPPLDGGRVQFAPPQEWKLLPRDSKYLARLVKGKPNELPRIVVSAMPTAAGEIADVAEENFTEFVKERKKASAAVKGRKMIEPVRPIILAGRPWARHVRYVEFSGSPAALQSLETARGGRRYVIELTVQAASNRADDMAKAILEHRDAAYALAANWRFLDESPAPQPDAATSQTGGQKQPASAKPAEHGE